MANYCEPRIDSWDWHDADTWDAPMRDRVELSEFVRPRPAVISRVEPSLEDEFSRLVSAWRQATEDISSATQIISDPSYRRIIDLGKRGEAVLPLIFKDLKYYDGGFWSTALHEITGVNPVHPKHAGNAAKVRKDWLSWAKQHGYI
jgi:hypothetical protein